LTRLGFSILRFCLGNGNGGGRLIRGWADDACRVLSDEDDAGMGENVMMMMKMTVRGPTEKFGHFMRSHLSHIRNHSTSHSGIDFFSHLLQERRIL
jgi:hypothetical protein